MPSRVDNENNDSVSMETLIYHNVKSVIFTRLEYGTGQKRANIVYTVDTDSDGN